MQHFVLSCLFSSLPIWYIYWITKADEHDQSSHQGAFAQFAHWPPCLPTFCPAPADSGEERLPSYKTSTSVARPVIRRGQLALYAAPHFDTCYHQCHLLALVLEVMGYCQYGQSTDMDSCIAMSGGELGPGFSINYTFVKALSNCEITIEGSIENVRQFISIHQPALTASVSTPAFSPLVVMMKTRSHTKPSEAEAESNKCIVVQFCKV